ncbi:unnamed protein product [Rotaria socialis]|uniref:Uncharacterized protein n=1 Tax=Rotaria socialis TaxID=392032 RepID=A0A820VRP4_9BILA|nr:unnamed protein product [Rotaria socialis]CAF4795198.1 unnamed protein product [Rotaria socialis]
MEADNLFQQCSQNEDRHDLANKVFSEASSPTSDTVQITKVCSRELEKLLPFVTSPTILSSFFDRLTALELDDLIRDRFQHVFHIKYCENAWSLHQHTIKEKKLNVMTITTLFLIL